MNSGRTGQRPVIRLRDEAVEQLVRAVKDTDPVTGLTHNFYRYPARFSPSLVRAAIEAFTQPGDLVLDPFVGGGTTLVEAMATGRHSIGTDISALATFVTEVKTTIYSGEELNKLRRWGGRVIDRIDLHAIAEPDVGYSEAGYLRNLNGKGTWRLRKAITQALASADSLKAPRLVKLARCAVLRTAQWALDGRKILPSVAEFRERLAEHVCEMAEATSQLADAAAIYPNSTTLCLNRATHGLEHEPVFQAGRKPRLVVTSPPYPGVHVLYHRWQVHGGKETPAPFWIANRLDGDGAAYYTMGDRKSHALGKYFVELRAAFGSIAAVCDHETTVVQVIAFSDPDWQLPRYLSIADDAGFEEHFLARSANGVQPKRLWRRVPNRKWYATHRGETGGSKEVVLFHQLRR